MFEQDEDHQPLTGRSLAREVVVQVLFLQYQPILFLEPIYLFFFHLTFASAHVVRCKCWCCLLIYTVEKGCASFFFPELFLVVTGDSTSMQPLHSNTEIASSGFARVGQWNDQSL